MSNNAAWELTESDPSIFTGLLRELGCVGLEIEELYGLDSSLLAALEPVKALIFLFKWRADTLMAGSMEIEPTVPFYFSRQTIQNACGSIAILNSVLNVHDPHVSLGPELENLKSFSTGLDSESCGEVLASSETIRRAHNSFSRNDSYSLEESTKGSSEDAYHFIAYLPIGDKLFELDGLKPSPIFHADIPTGANWLDLATTVLQARINTHIAGETGFNLLAITGKSSALQRRADELVAKSVKSNGEIAELESVQDQLLGYKEKFKEWDDDNAIRKHNHLGLIHQLLLSLAKEGKLTEVIDGAKVTMKEKLAEQAKKKKDGMEFD